MDGSSMRNLLMNLMTGLFLRTILKMILEYEKPKVLFQNANADVQASDSL